MDYLDSVIRLGDKVYVLSSAKPMFLFYNDYLDDELDGLGNEVMIGEYPYNLDIALDTGLPIDHTAEYEYIEGSDKCYIVASNTWNTSYDKLYERLSKTGSVQVIYSDYGTPLLLYEKNK